jgi:hypothetical protein
MYVFLLLRLFLLKKLGKNEVCCGNAGWSDGATGRRDAGRRRGDDDGATGRGTTTGRRRDGAAAAWAAYGIALAAAVALNAIPFGMYRSVENSALPGTCIPKIGAI